MRIVLSVFCGVIGSVLLALVDPRAGFGVMFMIASFGFWCLPEPGASSATQRSGDE